MADSDDNITVIVQQNIAVVTAVVQPSSAVVTITTSTAGPPGPAGPAGPAGPPGESISGTVTESVVIADVAEYYEADLSEGSIFNLTILGNTQLAIASTSIEDVGLTATFVIKQGVTPFAITWPENTYWPNSVEPTVVTPEATTVVKLVSINAGFSWLGYLVAQDLTSVQSNTRTLSVVIQPEQANWLLGLPLSATSSTPVESVLPWVADSLLFEDKATLKSGAISDEESSLLDFSLEVIETAIVTFNYLCSTEEDCDYFNVYINGIESLSISGITSWESFSANLEPGLNTVRFEFIKDGSGFDGEDAVWITTPQFMSVSGPYQSQAMQFDTGTVVSVIPNELEGYALEFAQAVDMTINRRLYFIYELIHDVLLKYNFNILAGAWRPVELVPVDGNLAVTTPISYYNESAAVSWVYEPVPHITPNSWVTPVLTADDSVAGMQIILPLGCNRIEFSASCSFSNAGIFILGHNQLYSLEKSTDWTEYTLYFNPHAEHILDFRLYNYTGESYARINNLRYQVDTEWINHDTYYPLQQGYKQIEFKHITSYMLKPIEHFYHKSQATREILYDDTFQTYEELDLAVVTQLIPDIDNDGVELVVAGRNLYYGSAMSTSFVTKYNPSLMRSFRAVVSNGTDTLVVTNASGLAPSHPSIMCCKALGVWVKATGTGIRYERLHYANNKFFASSLEHSEYSGSLDGLDWHELTFDIPLSVAIHNILYCNNKYVILAGTDVYHSADGVAFTRVSTSIPVSVLGGYSDRRAATNGAIIIVPSTTAQQYYSLDCGLTWAVCTSPNWIANCAYYLNGKFFAIGYGIASSLDGITFTEITTLETGKRSLSHLVFTSGLYVAFGEHQYKWLSADGINWSSQLYGYADGDYIDTDGCSAVCVVNF